MMRLSVLSLLVLSSTLANAGGDFPGIQKLMTEEQYRAAGLGKLTEEERNVLNQWLIGYTAVEAQVVAATSEAVREAEEVHEIHANVITPFRGWDGDTVFYLDNGQVWRQRLKGRFRYDGSDTRVVIKKNFLGFYKLLHVATGRGVGVSVVQ